ncbi:Basement membrane-specific heparan sulfate proteoglycan core protein-like 3, partial [Homarus americanus]
MVMYVGQTAELRCEASGINPSDVRWTRMRGRLPPGAIEHGNLLRLPYVQPEDSGMYQCEAITPSGYRSSDVITLTVTRLESVEVKIRPSRSNVRIGDDVEFTCEVRGGSDAALSWSRMNSGLPSNAQPWNNVLRIFNVQPDNGGVYRCTVTTANGVFEGSYALAIQ